MNFVIEKKPQQATIEACQNVTDEELRRELARRQSQAQQHFQARRDQQHTGLYAEYLAKQQAMAEARETQRQEALEQREAQLQAEKDSAIWHQIARLERLQSETGLDQSAQIAELKQLVEPETAVAETRKPARERTSPPLSPQTNIVQMLDELEV